MSSRSSLSRAVLAYSVVPLGGAQRFSHRSFGLYFGESPLRLTPSLRIRAGIIVKRCRSFPFPHLHPSPPKYTQFCSFANKCLQTARIQTHPKAVWPEYRFFKEREVRAPVLQFLPMATENQNVTGGHSSCDRRAWTIVPWAELGIASG